MDKTFRCAFLAVCAAAAAGAASAEDVSVYGIIDTGLQYQHVKSGLPDESVVDNFGLNSGISTGSRWGIKGSEDLGNGLSVGFVLENGFSSDDGTMLQGSRLFGREAQVYIEGSLGRLAFGRFGSLASGSGTYAIAGKLSPFGTTWGDYSANAPNVMAGFDRYDNMISYRSPSWAGVQLHAQYSFGTDAKKYPEGGVEGKSSVDRYYALGLTYKNGPLNLVGVVDSTNLSSLKWSDATTGEGTWQGDVDDTVTATVGGSYDFSVLKLYAGFQYYDNADITTLDGLSITGFPGVGSDDLYQMEGFGLTVGVDAPLWGGKIMAAAAYADASIDTMNGGRTAAATGDIDFQRINVSLGYQYNLSKRTSLYGVASYSWNKYEADQDAFDDIKPKAVEAALGLVHRF